MTKHFTDNHYQLFPKKETCQISDSCIIEIDYQLHYLMYHKKYKGKRGIFQIMAFA